MQFVFTEEQQMMTEMAQGFFGDHCTTAALRELAEQDAAFDPARWRALAGLGLIGALVSEEAGGLGLGAPDVIGIAQASGAALLPEPLMEIMSIVLPALEALGRGELIGDVMTGERLVLCAHSAAHLVVEADRADHLLLIDEDRIALLSKDTAKLTEQPDIDPLRRLFTVSGTGETLAEGEKAYRIATTAYDAGALMAAAQLLGIAQKMVELSVAYAGERQQFGKPIGVNQAIKHQLASVQVAIEFARPVLHAASAAPATEAGSARISHAKIACGRAADLATRTAIQVHGGMGYTMDTDVHFYLKRALGLRAAWGTETDHRRRYQTRLDSLPFAPDTLFPEEAAHA